MQHLDDGTIHAWLDGALGTDAAPAVEAHVAACRACADRVAEARGLIAASSRILMALDDVPADVVPVARPAAAAAGRVAVPAFAAATPAVTPDRAALRRRWGHRYGRIAAVIAFVAAGTLVLTREANRRGRIGMEKTANPAAAAPARRDVTSQAANPAKAAQPAPEAALASPPTALGGVAPKPVPAAPPRAKSLAVEPREPSFRPGEAPSRAAVRQSGGASKVTDTMAAAMQAQSSSTLVANRFESLKAGVAVAPQGAPGARRVALRPVAIDSVPRGSVMVRRETYEVGSGTRVVLEITPPGNAAADSTANPAAPFPAGNAPAVVADSASVAIHVLRWRGADGTAYTLSGPVSTDELQRIRAALGNRP